MSSEEASLGKLLLEAKTVEGYLSGIGKLYGWTFDESMPDGNWIWTKGSKKIVVAFDSVRMLDEVSLWIDNNEETIHSDKAPVYAEVIILQKAITWMKEVNA